MSVACLHKQGGLGSNSSCYFFLFVLIIPCLFFFPHSCCVPQNNCSCYVLDNFQASLILGKCCCALKCLVWDVLQEAS